jgi:uncharacterized membrane protein
MELDDPGTTINHIQIINRAIIDGSVRGCFKSVWPIRLISGLGSAEKTRIVQIPQTSIYFVFRSFYSISCSLV